MAKLPSVIAAAGCTGLGLMLAELDKLSTIIEKIFSHLV